MILNFLSMFVVIPYLTSDPTTYGIYSICISFSIFLTYADLGFIGAGQKYAAECYARGETEEEIKIIGFTNFILFIFIILLSAFFLILSFNPEILVKGLTTNKNIEIASSLLLILAIFTPTTLLQRLLQMIFGTRMEDYIIQTTNIIANLFKITSVLWFFRAGEYNIVGYFLFGQITNLIAAVVVLLIAKKRYEFNFIALFKALRFNKEEYLKTKKLAFASLYLTLSWILYYELDSVSIGKLFGAQQVAVYAIGLTMLTFFRSILGIIFSPFNVRFNHFIGTGDEITLKSFYLQIVTIFAPVVIFPIVVTTILAKSIVLSWVGAEYSSSVGIIQFLILCNILAFISYPTNSILIAQERQKALYFVNTLLPFVFWVGVLSTINIFGIRSFAIFKFIAFLVSGLLLFRLMINYLDLTILESLKKIFLPMLFPLLFLIFASYYLTSFLPQEKSKLNLLIVASVMGVLIFFSFIIQYFVSENWRNQVSKSLALLKNK